LDIGQAKFQTNSAAEGELVLYSLSTISISLAWVRLYECVDGELVYLCDASSVELHCGTFAGVLREVFRARIFPAQRC